MSDLCSKLAVMEIDEEIARRRRLSRRDVEIRLDEYLDREGSCSFFKSLEALIAEEAKD